MTAEPNLLSTLPDGEQIVTISADDYPRVLELLEVAFPKTPLKFFYSIVLRDPKYRSDFSLAIMQKNRVVSHVQMYDRTLMFQGQPIRFGGIANVSTRPECRGRGYAQILLKLAVEIFKREGMLGSMLFTDINPFYERLGWKNLEQLEQDVSVESLKNLRPPFQSYRRILESDYPALQEIFTQRQPFLPGTQLRDLIYWSIRPLWMEHPGVVVLDNEKIVAYFYAAQYEPTQPILTIAEYGYRTADDSTLALLAGAIARKAEEMACTTLRGYFLQDENFGAFLQSRNWITAETPHHHVMWKDFEGHPYWEQFQKAASTRRFHFWQADAF